MNSESNRPGSLLMLASSMLIFGTIGIFRRHILLSSGLLAFARGAIGAVFLAVFVNVRALINRRRGSGAGNISGKSSGSVSESASGSVSESTSGSTSECRSESTSGSTFGSASESTPGSTSESTSGRAAAVPGTVSGKQEEEGKQKEKEDRSSQEKQEYEREKSVQEDRQSRQRLSPRMLFMLILSGALIGINWILLFEAYNYTTVAIATLCYYMLPTIIILVSPFVFGERLTVKKLICALIAVFGMFLVSGAVGEGVPQGDALLGIIYGLSAALFYAAVVIMNKKWIVNVDPYLKTMIQLASASVCLIPYLFVTGQFTHVELDGFSLLMVLIMGLVHTGIAYTLYFGSTDGLKAQTIALVSYIDPVSALFFSVLFLREPLGLAGMAGAVLILGAAFAAEK